MYTHEEYTHTNTNTSTHTHTYTHIHTHIHTHTHTYNSLLSSGEVPGMYTHEELEPLMAR
jgi:hypothetical protein